MGRREDLEQNIRESYQLIREYEDLRRLSSDPKEKARAQRAIEEQRKLIRECTEEYRQISGTPLPHRLDETTGPVSSTPSVIQPVPERSDDQPEKPLPRLGYFFVSLLVLDLIIALMLGWRFIGHQPELLSYLQAITGILGLVLSILVPIIAIQKQIPLADIPRWLETSLLWQGLITVVTLALLLVLLSSQFVWILGQAIKITPQTTMPPETEVNSTTSPITSTIPVSFPPMQEPALCRIESFEAQPPASQSVGTLVIFKIRGACESGVRAIRLLINDEWYGEKGGHIAPAEEFVPTWPTKDLSPGDYKITAEVATWGDDDWAFVGRQVLTYTLFVAPSPTNSSSPTAVRPWFGLISFCLELDDDNRCISPTNQLPAGITRFYISWPFLDVPLGTRFRRIWYRDGSQFKDTSSTWNNTDWNSPTGVEYTFLDNEDSFPNGEYVLELYFEGETEPIQRATVKIGP